MKASESWRNWTCCGEEVPHDCVCFFWGMLSTDIKQLPGCCASESTEELLGDWHKSASYRDSTGRAWLSLVIKGLGGLRTKNTIIQGPSVNERVHMDSLTRKRVLSGIWHGGH